ncbi:MAG: hypothetical protein CMJ99_10395 [Planctomycetes bacterium]|nr:hypothetical protein [Planctomycetota bacterium]
MDRKPTCIKRRDKEEPGQKRSGFRVVAQQAQQVQQLQHDPRRGEQTDHDHIEFIIELVGPDRVFV